MTMLAQFAAAAGGALPAYIEDVFSTYLYTGNSSTQTITNGIDLAGKGGLVWCKDRSVISEHGLFDTVRGATYLLRSNSTAASAQISDSLTSFNSNGFSIGADTGSNTVNASGDRFASWTFRKQPKFFDVVTYTGDGSDPRNIAHNLGSVPGSMIIKCTSTGATDWFVYHRSLGNSQSLNLNQTGAAETGTQVWGTTTPTSTVFTVGNINSNTNGRTYVAYLFAHDAGGFGLSGNENVVSCGSYVGNGVTNGPEINLGYEPQWVMVKRTDSTGSWLMYDVMRGASLTGFAELLANSSGAEYALSTGPRVYPTATGFKIGTDVTFLNNSGSTYIYIAIRRGPMKVPTLGTSVFTPIARTGTGTAATITGAGFPPDLAIIKARSIGDGYFFGAMVADKLRGPPRYLVTSDTTAEDAGGTGDITAFNMNGISIGGSTQINYGNAGSYINYLFRRAPSFFDEVCYTGTGNPLTLNHNLGVAPELILYKSRSNAEYWLAQSSSMTSVTDSIMVPNLDNAEVNSANFWRTPNATTFGFAASGNLTGCNTVSQTYVAYLFASCAGVSKVGSYTGTGTTQAIACGFTTGARFVLIKRTDSTGDWYYWDSARGIVAGNDPYLLINTTGAEVTGTDYVDTSATGFELSSTAPAAINASGGSYIFLAVA